MASYKAPVKDIRFVLHQLLDDAQLSQLPGLEDYSPEVADSILDAAATFAEEVLDPLNQVGDREGAKWTEHGVVMPIGFREAYRRYCEDGWTTLNAPVEHGGQGMPKLIGVITDELWAGSNIAFQLMPQLGAGALEALELCASDEQKTVFAPRIVSGEWGGTMNLTEPQAGTDLGVIRTRAAPEDDHYRIFGQKIFITYGDQDFTDNIIHLVLARIDGAPAATKGISLFIVPKVLVNDDGSLGAANEVRCVSIEHKLGIHASPTCVLSYGDKQGAIGYLVGEANRGLEYMFIMMNAARLAVGVQGYALAERAYQFALDWARNRIQGQPVTHAQVRTHSQNNGSLSIAYHADVRRMLLTMRASTEAARALALYCALQLDIARHQSDAHLAQAAQRRGELLIPIIKAWSTDVGIEAASLGIQVHGGMGFIEETGAAQILRDVRITAIYEGTNGVQAIDLVERKLGRDEGAAMTALLAEMENELDKLQGDTGTAALIKETRTAVHLLRDTTLQLLTARNASREQGLAVAVPYLSLCALVLGAHFMTRADQIATAKMADDKEFYQAKRQTARFFIEHLLPQVYGLARIVTHGAACVAESDPDLL